MPPNSGCGLAIKFGMAARRTQSGNKLKATNAGLFYQNDELIGFAQAYEKVENGIHIACLIVNPKMRGKGLGRLFVKALMENAWAQEQVRFITLNVYPENKPARSLYKDLGFHEVGENNGMVSMQLERE